MLGLMLSCSHLEVIFERVLHFHFSLGPVNYIAGGDIWAC